MRRLLVLCVIVFAMPLCAATFDVTNLNDSGAGSLRQAILDHQSAGGTNTIDFTVSGTVTLASNLPTFNTGSLTVNGHASGSTIDGAGSFRAFAADNALALTLNELTITNCSSFFGPGVYFFRNGSLTLNLNDCVFTGNSSAGGTATVFVQHDVSGTATVSINRCTFSGGIHRGLYIASTTGTAATITDTTISGHTSTPYGSALLLEGVASATLTNCTISNNSAGSSGGGGIYVDQNTSATLINCTVTGNTAGGGGGGGIKLDDNTASLTLQNTIVASNTATTGPDIYTNGGSAVTSNDGNLIGDNSDMTMTPQSNDQVGTSGSPIDPMLGALADNGGPTQTRALQTGSPAINAGVSGGPSLDQRGILRDFNTDIGAYELAGSYTVTNLNDSGAGSLRQAIADFNAAGGTGVIDFTVTGTVNTTSFLPGISAGDVTINAHTNGNTVAGAGTHAILAISSGSQSAIVTINGLGFTNGSTTTGSAISVQTDDGSSTLNLNNCTISGNDSTTEGAVFSTVSGTGTVTLNIDSCTFSGNTSGASLVVAGGPSGTTTATITNSTFSGNNANVGAGIVVNRATAGLVNCTITNNSATTGGGGVYLVNNSGATLTLQNTIIAGNTAPSGPDIDLVGTNTVTSNDGNLIGDNSGLTMTPQSNDQVGTSGSPIDPMLDVLADNGGPTMTHALLSGSPATNAGISGGPADDQRGTARDLMPDIGAFEFVASGGGGGGGDDNDESCSTGTNYSFTWLALLGVIAALGWRARGRQA